MRTVITRMLIAVVLAIAAWLSWSESKLAARVADAKQDIATLNHDNLDALDAAARAVGLSARRSPAFVGRRSASPKRRSRTGWDVTTRSPRIPTTASATPTILLAAANAAYREAQRDPATGPAAVQRLDGVLQAYASALKASPRATLRRRPTTTNTSRAFAIRWRDRRKAASQDRPLAAGPVMGGDLPAGPTIHGGPGAPPPDAKMEEFQTIAPMEYGDREAQPEATPGAKRERKG